MKIKILSVGKTKELWLEQAFTEYSRRLKGSLEIECLWAKNTPQLTEWAFKEKGVVCLDPQGSQYTSEQFSSFLWQQLEKNGARLTMIIGAAEGLPPEVKKLGPLISLSPLTFTHQIARLILIEQIYRALEISKGSNYHK
jgi:23S rRNA (pseudouridine1915-N3)-methyltransferase